MGKMSELQEELDREDYYNDQGLTESEYYGENSADYPKFEWQESSCGEGSPEIFISTSKGVRFLVASIKLTHDRKWSLSISGSFVKEQIEGNPQLLKYILESSPSEDIGALKGLAEELAQEVIQTFNLTKNQPPTHSEEKA